METNFENIDRNENESPSVLPYNKEIKEKQKKKLNFDSLNPAFIMTLLGAGKFILLNIFDYGCNCDFIVLKFISGIATIVYLFAFFSCTSVAMIAVPIVLIVRYYNQRKQQCETIKAWSRVIDIFLTVIASLLFALSIKFQYDLILNCF